MPQKKHNHSAKWITAREASERYSVSLDWLYRNDKLVCMRDGRRFVRFSVASLDQYFAERTFSLAG